MDLQPVLDYLDAATEAFNAGAKRSRRDQWAGHVATLRHIATAHAAELDVAEQEAAAQSEADRAEAEAKAAADD